MENAITVAYISNDIISLLKLKISSQIILFGVSNREHIKKEHPATFAKYSQELVHTISSILQTPDFVGSRDGAIEYIKIMPDGEILKIAVRESKNGVFFARTLYPIQQDELNRFLAKNTLIKVS
jgi:hypothetical protein